MKILPIADEKQDSDLKEALIRKNSHSKHGNDQVCAVQLDYIEYGLDMILALVPQNEDRVWIHSTLSYQSDLVDSFGQCLSSIDLHRCSAHFSLLPCGRQVFTDYQNKCIKSVNVEGEVVTLFSTQPLRPCGIFVTESERGLGILVSLEDNVSYQPIPTSQRMVKHYSLKGDVICIYRCDEQSDDSSPLFNRPDALTQNRNKDICVVNRTDFDSGEVCIITEEGNLKSRYQGNGLTFDPCGICCDSKMNIIVSDYSNTCVHLLTCEGEFSAYLLTRDTLLGDPWCVGIYNDCLWLGCNRGRIERYRLLYKDS